MTRVAAAAVTVLNFHLCRYRLLFAAFSQVGTLIPQTFDISVVATPGQELEALERLARIGFKVRTSVCMLQFAMMIKRIMFLVFSWFAT